MASSTTWPPKAGLSTVNVPRKDGILPVHASIRINAPAQDVFAALLNVSDYGKWNTFCPEVKIQGQDAQKLQPDTPFTFYVVMNSSKPDSRTETGLRVSDISTPSSPSTYVPQSTLEADGSWTADLQKIYRVAWKSEGGFVAKGLRSERFHEVIVLEENECEVRTWEVMGGVLAHTVKWMYKQTLMDKFELWCNDLKKYCERA
ncbi:hypothetical protein LTR56_009385 [Elasticomyces elasticus]|nr:hypothetical protein LTR22_022117 [Elasticomyces elasticus]KAK3644998.1 hypothetical protein LTR56_009385 [Elasticomyces elasticus]KAK5766241.1 hypothetical protein LTS12_003452 [Elasticomyces elasticus]